VTMKRQRTRLGELCTLVKGTLPILKTRPGMYPLVTTGEEHKTADAFQIDGEAVCIPLISSTGRGHASLKRVHYQTGKFALGNLLVAALVKDRSVLSTQFLAHYLTYTKDRLIVPLMTGVANMSISIDRLETVPVEFPPMADQERIVRLLDDADGLRELRARADGRSAALLPALFHQMFGDPASNSKNWPIARLGDIAPLKGGYSFKSTDYSPDGVRLVRISNLDGQNLIFGDGTAYLPESFLERYAAFKLSAGDILIAMSGATTGKLGMVRPADVPSLLNQRVGKFVIRDLLRLEPIFLFSTLGFPAVVSKLIGEASGSAQANVSPSGVGSVEIPIPPFALQKEFAKQVTKIRELDVEQAASRARLEAFSQSLLHRAFNGEL
jgi:type I restriction enzyme S subunit